MKVKHLVFILLASFIMLYIGAFLGDLGGVGGYDGIAPKWLYEKINIQPGNDTLFHLAEKGSLFSLASAVGLWIIFFICLVIFLIQKVKQSDTKS
ncbi:hypothetical protein [Amphritea pacifica]|uniref:PDGLE domain-containing protein n=1 Tax=Amphritea pacifica TaxID=2811233 RepID=A0ABS2WDT7_9GAMM|nr:hypothetical protein [Amphritea pacifica]MBN0989885.1 hypothetical protein [Amphritea pacifica]